MRLVSLTGTNLSTSRLGFGTAGLHQLLRSRRRQNLLAAAFAAGVQHYDTSPFYGHGIAEHELGKFTQDRRSKVLVATKFGVRPSPLLVRNPWLMYARLAANAVQRKVTKQNHLAITPSRDYSADEARLSLERSLRALRTDHVDIYFLHDPNRALLGHADDLMSMLDRLRQEGKTRYIGLAGAASECIDVAAQFPNVAQVMQISAAGGPQALDLVRNAGLRCHVSFGHFRDKSAPMKSLLRDAIKQNPTGVLLYSSRHAARVTQVARELTGLETQ
jgi:aryl-alcohol dehydrogenase-like predicted oxidoreductase